MKSRIPLRNTVVDKKSKPSIYLTEKRKGVSTLIIEIDLDMKQVEILEESNSPEDSVASKTHREGVHGAPLVNKGNLITELSLVSPNSTTGVSTLTLKAILDTKLPRTGGLLPAKKKTR